MKGIILAGGTGTRLWPMTISTSKQLLPVFDKPLVYYPLGTLLSMGVREILIICRGEDKQNFELLLGDGSFLGVSISYEIQSSPRGLADAFLIGETFLGDSSSVLILGDNIFYGIEDVLQGIAATYSRGAYILGAKVSDPERYGVITVDARNQPSQIVEKPTTRVSDIAIPGLYFVDETVVDRAKSVQPSHRGELEIVDVLRSYLIEGALSLEILSNNITWMDCGTPTSLNDASNFVRSLETRQKSKVSCIEEIAFNMGYISAELLAQRINFLGKGDYANYLRTLIEG